MGVVGDIRDAMFKNLIPEERVWEIEVAIVMPTYTLEVEAATEADAIERALEVLNQSGDIPEHGECDVDVRLKRYKEVCNDG
jgi:hypothetical protein